MKVYIDLMLTAEVKNNADRPLVLHTLPASNDAQKCLAQLNAQDANAESNTSPSAQTPGTVDDKRMPVSTATIPRLISVAEIIKREWLKSLDTSLAESGNLVGLHQYNEIGDIEETLPKEPAESPQDEEDARQAEIARALLGKNQYVLHPKSYH